MYLSFLQILWERMQRNKCPLEPSLRNAEPFHLSHCLSMLMVMSVFYVISVKVHAGWFYACKVMEATSVYTEHAVQIIIGTATDSDLSIAIQL